MSLTVFCAAFAFLLAVVLGVGADVRPLTVITRSLVIGMGTACLTHMSAQWLANAHAKANADDETPTSADNVEAS